LLFLAALEHVLTASGHRAAPAGTAARAAEAASAR
jgi:hypothetical protein